MLSCLHIFCFWMRKSSQLDSWLPTTNAWLASLCWFSVLSVSSCIYYHAIIAIFINPILFPACYKLTHQKKWSNEKLNYFFTSKFILFTYNFCCIWRKLLLIFTQLNLGLRRAQLLSFDNNDNWLIVEFLFWKFSGCEIFCIVSTEKERSAAVNTNEQPFKKLKRCLWNTDVKCYNGGISMRTQHTKNYR